MIQKHFDAITKDDIEWLRENKERESKTFEFKEKLPPRTEDGKKEFLADVSSFANASGGDLIYGLKAEVDENGKKTGAPECVVPITGATADEAKLWLEQVMGTGIQPRLRVQIKEITGWGKDGQGFVILIRVPKSFASPHMVKQTYRFYCRNSAGKYPLDVDEIRSAFLASESQADRIKRFRLDRLGQIIADETPVRLVACDRLVLHVVPMASFLSSERLDLSEKQLLEKKFRPLARTTSAYSRYNLDGFLTYSHPKGGNVYAYCQVFFDGTVEAAYAGVANHSDGSGRIRWVSLKRTLVTAVESYVSGLKQLAVNAPVLIFVALLGCRGAHLYVPPTELYTISPTEGHTNERHSIDRDTLILPDILLESFDADVASEMQPIFDAVWNACGFGYEILPPSEL